MPPASGEGAIPTGKQAIGGAKDPRLKSYGMLHVGTPAAWQQFECSPGQKLHRSGKKFSRNCDFFKVQSGDS